MFRGTPRTNPPFRSFRRCALPLAATVGVGNIAGVAAAIVSGGPGAVFWMWVAAFFGMMTNFSENVLGIYFRRKNAHGEWSGGAMYYLQDGLGGKKGCKTIGKILAALFSVFAVLASFGIGNMGQVNKIVANIEAAFEIKALSGIQLLGVDLYKIILGFILMLFAALIILGGIQRIANFAEKIVPFMVCAFVLLSLVVIGVNFTSIGDAFAAIFKSAFQPNAAWGGAIGLTVSATITWGFKRGVFSNEAGLGSSVMVHSNSNVKEPVRQGMWGIFEVFADTMIVCTMTALVILTSGVVDLNTGMLAEGTSGDATLVAKAFDSVFSFGGMNLGRQVYCCCSIAVRIHHGAWMVSLRNQSLGISVRHQIHFFLQNRVCLNDYERRSNDFFSRLGCFRYLQRLDDDSEPDRRAVAFCFGV